MPYHIDIEKTSLEEYQEKLSTSFLPPSRQILKENLQERFDFFRNHGITNVKELLQTLKIKNKMAEFSEANCFSLDYLKILLREIKSTLPKPTKLSDFTTASRKCVCELEKKGIKTTMQLFENVLTPLDRETLAKECDVDISDIMHLTKLSDLSRIKWVGSTYAQILHDSGMDTLKKIAKSEAVFLHELINHTIKEHKVFKGQIGLNDVRILIDVANDLTLDIEY